MKISENVEDYLACIYDLSGNGDLVKTSEISNRLNLSPASVTEMTQKLASEGYLNYERYKGVTLTPAGNEVAKKIKRRHRLLERFLVDVLGRSYEDSHEEAMGLEHNISDESIDALSRILNNPTECPGGDPIPPSEHIDDDETESFPIMNLGLGDEGTISHLVCNDPTMIRRLISMGFVPGRKVIVEEQVPMGGPLLIRMNDTRVAIGRDYASLIRVSSDAGPSIDAHCPKFWKSSRRGAACPRRRLCLSPKKRRASAYKQRQTDTDSD
ncbi:MAG: metal-dependent transcriptional regulator [Euryarchaeota archaeon]|nr:metal-dependent transcriptional regulator [Euryarchaeota archaeon]